MDFNYKKKLFLDDVRYPRDSANYMRGQYFSLYSDENWDIVRNYNEFVEYFEKNGLPDFVSFDHDIHPSHYEDLFSNENWEKKDSNVTLQYDSYPEKTGYDCAKWLVEYCMEKNLKFPEYLVHSQNPVGKDNIEKYILFYKKHDKI